MRKDNWPEILHTELEKAAARDFAWGECDCFFWTAYIVEALTGENRAFAWHTSRGIDRPKYKSTRGMKKAVRASGFDRFFDMACAIYGQPLPPLTARRGDLVMIEIHGLDALGVCRGKDVMFKTRAGTTFYQLAECLHAWRID